LNGKGSLDWSPQSHVVYYFPSDIKIYGPVLPYEETEKIIIRTTGEKDPYEERYTDAQKSQLWTLDLKTRKTAALVPEKTSFYTHSLSPDGRKMAASVLIRNPVLTHLVPSYARLDLLPTGGGLVKTVFNDRLCTIPYAWAPDCRSIAYMDDGKLRVYDVGGDKTTS
jgi:dipeptidyl aminopeptidase/acylaminoacyl peptidase